MELCKVRVHIVVTQTSYIKSFGDFDTDRYYNYII